MQDDLDNKMRKTLATYHKLGIRRMAKTSQTRRNSNNYYLDLTNLWKTNSQEQNKQYQAIKDSDLFSDARAETFLKFNYRNYEPGTYNYSIAHAKIKRKNKKVLNKGTMQVTDLWSDKQMQEVMGSPAFPRDRLKILKLWGQKKGPEMPIIKSNPERVKTLP